MSKWVHKDIWRKYGNKFLIEVSRHDQELSEIDRAFGRGPNLWTIYAYIYPGHPRFSAFEGSDMWQPAASALPMHGGPSFMHVHESKGVITSYQVGCDYRHLHDDYFSTMGADEVGRFMDDADEIFEYLSAKAGEPA